MANFNNQNEIERTPEEAALIKRLKIFCRMRWFAIAGIISATLVAVLGFNVSFPVLPVFIICAIIALYNWAVIYQARGLDTLPSGLIVSKVRILNFVHLSLDLITLTALLHFTGGIENPFIFFIVLHIVAASIPLPYRTVYILASLVLVMVALLVGLEYAGIVPHVNLGGFASATLYREVSYILAVMLALATLLYSSAYMTTAIAGELRKRQRQVVQLREQLLAERTGQLEQASLEIARLDEEKSRFLRFLSIAAHDLKAPLTAIQGFLWLMLKGIAGDITDKQRNMLERSSLRITELLTLISDLLDIPRIETGQIVSEMKEISLSEVIKQTADELRNQATEKGLQLNVELPENLAKVYGSQTRLKQAVTNLLNNAICYTPSGEVTVFAREQGNEIHVEVRDTGIGVPAADLPKIFEDFYRGSNVEVKGTGLGLSITRRIIEAHGGKIWVESPYAGVDKGSKFTFTIPKRSEAERRQA